MVQEVDTDDSGELTFVPDPLLLEQSLNRVHVKLAVDDLEIEDVLASLHFLAAGREVAVSVAWLTRRKSLIGWTDRSASHAFHSRLSVAELLLQFIYHCTLGSEFLRDFLCL